MAFLGGPGVSLPVLSGALGVSADGTLPKPDRDWEMLHKAVDTTFGIRWGLIRGRQKKLQSLAFDALHHLAQPGGLPSGTNLNYVRRVFRVISGEMKRDGDAMTIQQCEDAFRTQRQAVRSLQAQRKAYKDEGLALKEVLPGPKGGAFDKSDALQLIDDQIKEAKENLNTLSWAVLTSMSYGVKDVSYESLPKVNAEYNRMLKLYYQINGTPVIGSAPAEDGLMQKLGALARTTDETMIRDERVQVSPQAQIKKHVQENGQQFAISAAAGILPDIYNGVSAIPFIRNFVPSLGSAQGWVARIACMSVVYGIQWLIKGP